MKKRLRDASSSHHYNLCLKTTISRLYILHYIVFGLDKSQVCIVLGLEKSQVCIVLGLDKFKEVNVLALDKFQVCIVFGLDKFQVCIVLGLDNSRFALCLVQTILDLHSAWFRQILGLHYKCLVQANFRCAQFKFRLQFQVSIRLGLDSFLKVQVCSGFIVLNILIKIQKHVEPKTKITQ